MSGEELRGMLVDVALLLIAIAAVLMGAGMLWELLS